jgi:hypothetical protein
MSKLTSTTVAGSGRERASFDLAALATSGARVRSVAGRLLRYRVRFGRQGMAAALLAVAASALYPLSIAPSLARIDAARQRLAAPRPRPAAVAIASAVDSLDRLQAGFDVEARFPDRLGLLGQHAAGQGLALNDGAYTVVREAHGRIVRYEVTLPVHGSYPQIRRFIAAVLARDGAAALLDVQFHRAKVADPTLDAVVRLAYFMRAQP